VTRVAARNIPGRFPGWCKAGDESADGLAPAVVGQFTEDREIPRPPGLVIGYTHRDVFGVLGQHAREDRREFALGTPPAPLVRRWSER
jgi:hypothetical protein